MSDIATLTEVPKEELPLIPKKTLDKTKRYIISKMQNTQKFPSMEWLAKRVGISRAKTSIVMKVLLQEGFLLRKGNRYILSDTQLDSFSSVSAIDKAKAALKLSPGIIILKGLFFLIGAGATAMSVFHSKDILSDFYTMWLAITCASLMIGFNILSSQLGVFCYIKRHIRLSVFFFTLLVLGTVFSMGSTVMGLYTARSKDITLATTIKNKETYELTETTLDYQNILERKQMAEADFNMKQLRVNTLIPIVAAYTEEAKKENSRLFDDDNFRLILANRDLKASKSNYEKIMEEEKQFLKTETITEQHAIEAPKDAYVWIGETINMDPDSLQFALSCYPAIFYDIIAPVSFSIVLFITGAPKKRKAKKRKHRKNNKRNKKENI